VTAWADLLDAGATQEEVLAAVLTSDEFEQKDTLFREGGADGRWLSRVSSETVVFWRRGLTYDDLIRRLRTGQSTRSEVAADILESDDYRARLVREDYRDILGRLASEAEVDAWLGAFVPGVRHEQFLADLLGSAEYFLRAGRND
jgi:hypothetical protein